MGSPLPQQWLLVQRADADPEDLRRVDRLAGLLGPAAIVRRTVALEGIDTAIADLDDRVLVVCGGDGSVHHAVNRLASLDRLASSTVGLFPAGTGNDLAHTLALPREAEGMATLLTRGATTDLDLLELGEHGLAVNALHAGVGVDAAARSAGLPDQLGALAYPLGAILAGVGAQGFEGEVEVDGQRVRPSDTDAVLMVLVLSGRTIGGGHAFVPDADPCDGLLDVVVCQATGAAARGAFGLAVTRGTHLDRDDVAAARGRTVRVRGADLSWNVDGELWVDRPIDDLTVRVRPGALRLVVADGPATGAR